jgi:AcrR family transcriptional regulator
VREASRSLAGLRPTRAECDTNSERLDHGLEVVRHLVDRAAARAVANRDATADAGPGGGLDSSYSRFIRSFDMELVIATADVAAAAGDGTTALTRERLLDAAEELFARVGYAGTSVRHITAAAGCNLAAVNYHFGGKSKLYLEVFRRRLAAMREQRLAAIAAATRTEVRPGDLPTVLLAFAEAFLAPLREDPEGHRPMRLLLREIADPVLPQGFLHSELIVPVNQAINIAVAASAPELTERTVRLCVQSFLGQLLHIVHAQRVAVSRIDEPPGSFTLTEMVEHVVRFTVAAIERLREESR